MELEGTSIAHDQHYTVGELAKRWHLSPNTVRRLVADERGVIRITIGSLLRYRRKRHLVSLENAYRKEERRLSSLMLDPTLIDEKHLEYARLAVPRVADFPLMWFLWTPYLGSDRRNSHTSPRLRGICPVR